MGSPTVSVIIPTFNRAEMLGTAIESVLQQTFRQLELLVVDDGSDDDTACVVRRYQQSDQRVRYLRMEHGGISAAVNAGIRATSGEYVARLDSDDIWMPDLLETEISILEARPEVGLVYAKGQAMNPDLTPRPATTGYAPHYPNDALRSMLWDDCTCNITVVVRRVCFDRVGLFDESLVANEDWDMWLRVACQFRFAFVDHVLARVRSHHGSTTSPRSGQFAEFQDSRPRVLDKIFARTDLPAAVADIKPIAYRNLYVHTGVLWIGAGDWGRAMRSFSRAVRVGGRPVSTLARAVFFILANQVLARTAWGRALLSWQSTMRLRLRVYWSRRNRKQAVNHAT